MATISVENETEAGSMGLVAQRGRSELSKDGESMLVG